MTFSVSHLLDLKIWQQHVKFISLLIFLFTKITFCVVPLKCWCSGCLSFLLRCESLEVWSEEPGKIIKALPLCLLHLFVAFYIYLRMVSYDVQHPAAAMNLKQPVFYSFTIPSWENSTYLCIFSVYFPLPPSDPLHFGASVPSIEPFSAAQHDSYNPKCHSSLLSRWTRLRRSEVTAPCDPEMIRGQKLSRAGRTKKTIKTPQFYHVSQYPPPYKDNWHLFLLLPCVLQDAVFRNSAIGKQNVAITRGRLHYK